MAAGAESGDSAAGDLSIRLAAVVRAVRRGDLGRDRLAALDPRGFLATTLEPSTCLVSDAGEPACEAQVAGEDRVDGLALGGGRELGQLDIGRSPLAQVEHKVLRHVIERDPCAGGGLGKRSPPRR